MSVFAANLYNIQYRVQPQTIGVVANHTIYFQSRTAISSGTIVLNSQNLISSAGSVTFSDIDLSYGSTADATQTQLTLGATAGNTIWGVAVDTTNKRITFSYPSSGSASIPADQVITIKIGTHATSQTNGANQLTNATTVSSGGKIISIVTGGEVGTISIPLVASGTLSSGGEIAAPAPAPASSGGAVSLPPAPASPPTPASPPASAQEAVPAQTSTTTPPTTKEKIEEKPVEKTDTTPPISTLTLGGTPGKDTWYKTPVTVTLSAKDDSGLTPAIYYRTIGETDNFILYDSSLTFSSAGEKTVQYYAVDKTGNKETQRSSLFRIDLTPPISALTLRGTVGQNNWYTGDVVVSLSATDTATPAPTIYYRIGTAGKFTVYKTPLTISSDGKNILTYYTADDAGNEETQKSAPIHIDTVSPIGSAVLNGGEPLSNKTKDIPLILTCGDTSSACAKVKLSQNNTSWTDWQDIISPTTIDYSSDGKKTLFVLFKDTAGNESKSIVLPEILIDTTPPVVSTDMRPADSSKGKETSRKLRSNELYAGIVGVLTAKLPFDDISSIASFQWEATKGPSNGDLIISNQTSQKTEISATVPGTYTLRVTVIDTAGNKRTSENSIKIVDQNEELTVKDLRKTEKTIDKVELSTKITIEKNTESTVRSTTAEIKLDAGSIDTSLLAQSSWNRPLSPSGEASGQSGDTTAASQVSGGGSGTGGGMSLQSAGEQGSVSIELSKLPCNIASETVGTDILAVSPPRTKLMGCAVNRVVANYQIERKKQVAPSADKAEQSFLQSVPKQGSSSLASRILQFLGRIDSMPVSAQEKSLPLYPVYQRTIPITEFQKEPTLTFLYTQKEASSIYVDTINLYAWDMETSQWILEKEVQKKQEENSVTAKVDHLSLFGLFAEPIPLPRHLREEVTYTATPGQFEQQKVLLENQDLGLTETNTKKEISFAENEFYTTTDTEIDMCIPAKIFQQRAVKKIILSSTGERNTLLYDKSKACYATHFKTPQKKGAYTIVLKIIYGDDVVQTVPLTMTVTSGIQAQVLATVAPSIKEVQKAATIINTETKKAVETSEPALQASVAVSVPIIAIANPAIAVNTIQWFYYTNYLFSWILSLLGLRKRRKPWGIVYDAITKTPIDLAIVRLIDGKTKKLIETQVTDKNGRFSFVPIPGEYTLTATKQEFLFPSKIITETTDGEYEHIYHQESITIKTSEETLQISIPLDQKPPAAFQKKTLHALASELIGKYALISLVVSMIISVALTTYVPSTFNAILLLVNGIFVMSQVMLMAHEEKPWGIVFNILNQKPVPLAAIAIFDAKQQKLLRSRLTDYYGRFNFLAPAGEFILSVSKEQYTFPANKDIHVKKYKHLYFGGTIRIKKGNEIVRTNIPLEEKKGNDQPIVQKTAQQTVSPSTPVQQTPQRPPS